MKQLPSTNKVMKLAKKAGFIFWSKNDWNPERVGKIDWACEYDQELVKFYNLVRDDLIKELDLDKKLSQP